MKIKWILVRDLEPDMFIHNTHVVSSADKIRPNYNHKILMISKLSANKNIRRVVIKVPDGFAIREWSNDTIITIVDKKKKNDD